MPVLRLAEARQTLGTPALFRCLEVSDNLRHFRKFRQAVKWEVTALGSPLRVVIIKQDFILVNRCWSPSLRNGGREMADSNLRTLSRPRSPKKE